MDFLTALTEIRTIQFGVCVGSFILALILLLIKVPKTEYSAKLATAKNITALSFLICTFLMGFSIGNYQTEDYEVFSSLTMLIAASFSSAAISFSMINLLDDKHSDVTFLSANIILIAVSGMVMVESFLAKNFLIYVISLVFCLILFVSHSIYYIIMFDRAYKKAIKQLEEYYDDDEDHKLRWIRFCYIIAMLTDLFLLVYMLLPRGMMKLYIAWYMLYMLYFAVNYISFIGSHKLTLDAFAHNVLSGKDLFNSIWNRKTVKRSKKQEEVKTAVNERVKTKEVQALKKEIETWVEQKKYREYDKSREEIAEELHTTKEVLFYYFTSVLGYDFRSWRTELRIADAKEMLLEKKDVSINLVGEMCGFSDRSNFHRQFTKIVGCSPKRWRESDGHPQNTLTPNALTQNISK